MKKIIFHPALLAVFPLLSVYLTNKSQIAVQDIFIPIAGVLGATLLVWYGVARWIRNSEKAAILVSGFVFIFFSFRSALWGIALVVFALTHDKAVLLWIETRTGLLIWLVFCLGLLALITQRILRAKWDLSKVTQVLNVVSACLLVVVGINWVQKTLNVPSQDGQAPASFSAEWVAQMTAEPAAVTPQAEDMPDIYYIVLDGYGREDAVAEYYDLDNSAFLAALEQKGFYIARNARANYMHTNVSLSSSLNWMYLDGVREATTDSMSLKALIAYNRTFRELRALGYEIATFSTDFSYTNITTADEVYSVGPRWTSYTSLLINATPLAIFLYSEQYQWHRAQIAYTLDTLPAVAQSGKPKFVFAHIFAPHPPFVFDAQGAPIYPDRLFSIADGSDFFLVADRAEYVSGYKGQVLYLNQKIEALVDQIMAESDPAPIIILQGDHGPGSLLDHESLENTNLAERMTILNAYYLPGKSGPDLYPGITPVNTFRLIFNEYFGSAYPLLPDKSYFSPNSSVFQFTEVTDQIPANSGSETGE